MSTNTTLNIPSEPDTFKVRSQGKLIALTLIVSTLICWASMEAVKYAELIISPLLTMTMHLVYFVGLGFFFWKRRGIPIEEV